LAQDIKIKKIIEDDIDKNDFFQSHETKIAWNFTNVCFIDKTLKEMLSSSPGYCLLLT